MVILLPLIRRLENRTRIYLGLACLVLGVLGVALAKALFIPGAVSVIVAAVFLYCGLTGRPRHRTASRHAARAMAGR